MLATNNATGNLAFDVCTIENDAEWNSEGCTPTFRLLDHEGSLVMTTNASGTVTGSNVLSPYGETISSNTTDAYSYAGLYQDTEYGGDAASFRNYTAEQLRWTRPDPYNGSYDPSNPQSMNRYVYAMNNPLGFTDPSGLTLCQDESGGYFDSGNSKSCGPGGTPVNVATTATVNGGSPTDPGDPTIMFYTGGLGYGGIVGYIGGWGANAPNNAVIKPISRWACASMIANDKYSIASQTNYPDSPITQAFLGNAISGLTDMWNAPSIGSGLKQLVIGGYNPGIPSGNPVDGGVVGVVTAKVLGNTIAKAVGLTKFAYDGATFAYAYYGCSN